MNDRDRMIRRVILIEGTGNVIVLIAKTFVGFATGSFAVIGDALHSLTDIANNIVAWLVIGMSSKPPDREHPYGHRKFETLAVFVLATMLTVLAIELALSTLRRGEIRVIDASWGLTLMFCVLIVNVGLATWQNYWAKRLGSDLLRADARHTFADVLTTLAVIAGWQLSIRGFPWLDTVCALGVSLLVFYLALDLFRRVVPVLVDHVAIEPEELNSSVMEVDGVRDVLQARSRWNGASRVVDMVITVDPDLPLSEAHRIADVVEAVMHDKFEARDVTIHVEPGETATEAVERPPASPASSTRESTPKPPAKPR